MAIYTFILCIKYNLIEIVPDSMPATWNTKEVSILKELAAQQKRTEVSATDCCKWLLL